MNILIVCTGNTCRSPMAEGYLVSKQLPGVAVLSRGLYADGSPLSENAALALREAGIEMAGRKSVPLTKAETENADKILCLSPSHKQRLAEAGVPEEKLFILGGGIADPFGGDLAVYRACRDAIFAAIDELIEAGFFASFTLLPIEGKHFPAVAKLEKTCFSEPWSQEGLLESYRHGTRFFVAERENKVLGYIGVNAVADEGYITNVAVFPGERKAGVGTALLRRAIDFAQAQNLAFLSLEVRVSNFEAIRLYQKLGFAEEGRRKGFYRNPSEDALIMTKRF